MMTYDSTTYLPATDDNPPRTDAIGLDQQAQSFLKAVLDGLPGQIEIRPLIPDKGPSREYRAFCADAEQALEAVTRARECPHGLKSHAWVFVVNRRGERGDRWLGAIAPIASQSHRRRPDENAS